MEKPKKQTKAKKTKAEAPKDAAGPKRIGLIRLRGKVHLRRDIKETMEHLNLDCANHCVVVDARPQYLGMIQKAKDYITWGEIDAKTFKKLLEKRAGVPKGKKIEDLLKDAGYKTVDEFSNAFMDNKAELAAIPGLAQAFRLSPPKGGFERGGIKKPITLRGALGYRGKNINKLIERMI